MSTEQMELDLAPLLEVVVEPDATLAERFAAFHDANPHVATALEVLATQWLTHHQRVGMKALFERLRWESGIQTHGQEWKLNNSFTALYARLLIDRHPEWTDAIQTRRLRDERDAA